MEKLLKPQAHTHAHIQTTSHAAVYLCVPAMHVFSETVWYGKKYEIVVKPCDIRSNFLNIGKSLNVYF